MRAGERVLELGAGLGLAAVLAARAGARVVATDILPGAVETIRANAALNGVTIDARLGDCYAPVAGERFDLVASNPPQMPTPPGRGRSDADGGRRQRRARRLGSARSDHQRGARAPGPGGRLVFTIFAFLGLKAAFSRCEAVGLAPRVVASEIQGFPRIGYERLEHLREIDAEGTLPRGLPDRVERFVIEGRLAVRGC